jgi:elongation factor P--(R)-beta-lysine ligase
MRMLELRARVYALIRQFFATRGILEVETPMLSVAANTEPNIESFSTRFSGPAESGTAERWLRTSAEFPLKRLLVEGVGDCYELGRVFRNGEAGRRHNPEFTMLEWYRVGWDHRQLIGETIDLVRAAAASVGRTLDAVSMSYGEWFEKTLKLDPFNASIEALGEPLREFRIDGGSLQRDDWLDLLITHVLQPRLPAGRITVISDWPASQCALARIRPGDPPVAERFELYLGPFELANGYHELCDVVEQRMRFENDNRRRRARGQRELPIDTGLLDALGRGLPDCAGVALGIERLLMCLAGEDDIRDVLAFGFAEA